jgi:glycosyltransferase involved in cell wall biosynthesis
VTPSPRDRPLVAPQRPKVIHLTTTDMSLDWLLGPQLRAFADAGYEVVGMSAPGPHVRSIEAAGIRHVAVSNLSRAPSLAQDLRASFELRRLLRAERPDVLHTHNPKPGVLGRIVGRAVGVPVIVNTQHGLYAQPADRRRRRWPVYVSERLAAACSHAELVQNPEDAVTLTRRLHVPVERGQVLGNGVDLARFDPARVGPSARIDLRREWGFGPDDIVCCVVGRLVYEKGYAEIFAAATALRTAGSRARFVVVGPADTDKADSVDAAAVESAKAAGVVFAGRRSDMPECYSACDLFVTASHREGFPRAAMEAGAMGLPIVATDIRGCRQVVNEGVNGTLVPVRDPAALATAVGGLITSDRLAPMAASARPYAQIHFDQQQVIDLTLATYDRLLSGG